MEVLLSILIPTLKSRKKFLSNLLSNLYKQKTDEVEIVINSDNGEKTIGEKRNELVRMSNGKYIAFVDDDDEVSARYVPLILAAIKKSNPDCVGITGIYTKDGGKPKKFIHSIRVKTWCERDGMYLRYPNHLNPVKREIALQAVFPHKSWGEDRSYSDAIRDLLKTQEMIDENIYFYKYLSKKKKR